MLKKIVNPLVVSAIALLPLMSACSSDTSKQEVKSAPAKEVAAPVKSAPAGHVFNIQPKKVADGIWCMFGALDMPKASNAGFMSNSCYIQTKDSWVLWDTVQRINLQKQFISQ